MLHSVCRQGRWVPRASSHIACLGARPRWNSSLVQLEAQEGEDEGIAVLTLQNPPANALSKQMLGELTTHLEALQHPAPTLRAVVVRSGLPKSFCAGADLKERATMTLAEVQVFVQRLRAAFTLVESVPVPTIAALDGFALGGGTELALACDLRVVGERAVMGLPETALGIIPGAGGTQRLPRLVGSSKAKELVFTAKRLTAAECVSFGLANRIAPAGETGFDHAMALAREIVPQGPIALRMAKRAIDVGGQVDIKAGMAVEELCYQQVIPTKDRLEGLAAFKEKRKPQYKGE